MIEWNVCENCGKILDKTQESCPFCGNDLTKVDIEFLKKELTNLLFLVKTIDSSNMEILKKDFPLIYEWKSKSYTLEGALINDLLNWFAYLGTANNDLSDNELEFINSLLNLNYSKEDIESLNSEITDLPVSFKFLHEQDVFKIRFDIYDVEFCEELFKIFKLTGKFFITVDDKLDDATLKRYEDYIKILRSNIDAIRTTTTPNDDDLRLPEPVVDIPSDKKTINDYLEELNRLVGLENVKKDVNSLINLVQIRKIREERGIKQPAMSLHLVFSGNPGTGKTTVARILSKIYHELGILSKGHLVECDRSGLVGGYVGQTAIKTQEMISSAMGGILFIDEAYSLASKSENDYGREAIDTILKAMEDNREDFIVIVAGYPKLMDDFLHSNPGLESRFNKFIYFSDYNPEELFDIFIGMCEDSSLKLDSKAEEYLKGYFEDIYNTRSSNFANGRAVRNLFEHVLTAQANRLVSIEDISDDELNTLVLEDFKFDD